MFTVLALVMAITRLGFTGPAAAYPGFTAKAFSEQGILPALSVQVELNGVGGGWTELKTDVLREPGVDIRIGIESGGPTDLVASTGTVQFSLNNSARNSLSTAFAYSPYHASKRSGWGLGIGCRIQLQNPNTGVTHTRFVGWIDAIDPMPGIHGPRSVHVTATDWFDEAARWNLTPAIGEQINQRGDQLLTALVAQVPRQPPATSFDTGADRYPFAFDSANIVGQSALSAMATVARSGFDRIHQRADGTLRFERRYQRILDTSTDWTITDADLTGLQLPSTRGELINKVVVIVPMTIVDPAPTTLVYDQASVITIAAGATQFLLGSFTNQVTGDAIGATDVQVPIAGTDYLLNAKADGSGDDLTAFVALTYTVGSNGAQFHVQNTGSATGYLTRLRLYGRGVYRMADRYFTASDATSIGLYGERSITVTMDYQASADAGQGMANYLLQTYATAFAQVRTALVFGITPALMDQILTRDLSDRLTVSETATGANSHFFINGMHLRVVPTGHVEAEYVLAPSNDPNSGNYWLLEVGLLGSTTVLAPI